MKFSNRDMQKITDIVTKLYTGAETLNEYVPLMSIENKDDILKIEKGLAVLNAKLDEIKNCESNKELKKVIRIKKIIEKED